MDCRICGDPVDPSRVELGYDYCLKDRCQQLGLKRVELAAIGVNKASDYYTTADELVPARLPMSPSEQLGEDVDPLPRTHRGAAKPVRHDHHQPPTTLHRLRELEAQLDRELKASYRRFERSETTAIEMERECDVLVAAFNQEVMGANIRYRSMLRPRRSPTRRTSGARHG